MKSCFLFGSSQASESIFAQLCNVIEEHINCYGVEYFLVGHYGMFDQLAASALRKVKEKYSHITAMLLLPYYPAQRVVEPPKGFDGTYYPDGLESVPMKLRIVRANREAIRASDHIIAYVPYTVGNSYRLYSYAKNCGKSVTLIEKP